MKYKELIYLIKTDLYRYRGKIKTLSFLRSLMSHAEFKYSFWLRVCAYLNQNKIYRYSIFYIAHCILRRYQYKYGILISCNTQIGAGLFIGHFGGIVINANTKIGKNFSLTQGVSIGRSPRGKRKGYATIGDNVYVGPGAKIVGRVTIGNNVVIGANCVVASDIPDNAVVAGIPGKVISFNGAEGYINRADYDEILKEIR